MGKAGRSPTRTRRMQIRPGPRKLNVAGYGTSGNQKGPPKWFKF